MELEVPGLRGAIVEDEHRACAAREEVLERQDLSPVSQRVLREQAEFGEAVEDDALGPEGRDPFHHAAHRLAQLHL
jgi:hypothetical protein